MLEDVMKEMEKGLCEALSQIAKKGAAITPTELDNATKAFCLLEKMNGMGEMEGGSSSRSYGMNYDGASNARGRSPVTGRYVSRDGGSYGGGSYDGGASSRAYRDGYHDGYRDGNSMGGSMNSGYSGHSIKDRIIATLEHMMDNASGDYEKKMVQDWIRKLESER